MSAPPTIEAVKAMLAQALNDAGQEGVTLTATRLHGDYNPLCCDADKLALAVMKFFGHACKMCGRVLNQGDDASLDCGGDCLACICEAEGRPLVIPFRRDVHIDCGGEEDE